MKNKIQNAVLNYDFASLYPTQIGDFSKLFEKEKLRRERKEKLEKNKTNLDRKCNIGTCRLVLMMKRYSQNL